MRVLHVIVAIHPVGGAELALARLIESDSRDEHLVVTLAPLPAGEHLLSHGETRCVGLGMRRDRLRPTDLLRLRGIVGRERPDVVQSWMYHADLVAGLALAVGRRPRLCWGVHHFDLDPETNRRSTLLVARACALLSRRVPDRIVYCAERSALVHERFGYARRKRAVIPNGFDLERFVPRPAARVRWRARWGAGDDTALVGCVARWHPQKDHANLFEAVAEVIAEGAAPFRLVLVGRDMDAGNAELRTLLARHGLDDRVVLVGPRDDVHELMSALDLHVLSSRGEAFPNVVCETMACGVPGIVTDVGDAATIVGDEGWVVPPRDPSALAGAIVTALGAYADETSFAARRLRARESIASRFGIDRAVERYRAVWLGAVGEGG